MLENCLRHCLLANSFWISWNFYARISCNASPIIWAQFFRWLHFIEMMWIISLSHTFYTLSLSLSLTHPHTHTHTLPRTLWRIWTSFFKWAIPGLVFFIFCLFYTVESKQKFCIKVCLWLDSNRGTLMSEATALLTEPQPLPKRLFS